MAPASILLVVLALAGSITARSPIPRTDIEFFDDQLEVPSIFNDYRIPTDTIPRHYILRISPDFDSGNFGYEGQVTITIAATQANVNVITLQSQDLTVISATVTPAAGGANILTNFAYNTTHNYLYLNLNSALAYNAAAEQLYTVYIVFQATMRTDMYGFYRSWYTHNNEIRWMGTTQFQATSARAAFPCYDEPSFKATFDIIIERPLRYSSWSNMRLMSTVNISETRSVDTFYTTPVMSTYLLAFIVAEYETLPVYNAQNQLTYEVIARPNAIETGQGAYALDVGQKLLAAMDAHTGIAFAGMDPNIKMTQASIPDFSAGAMENWGLLTYREAYLMYHPEHTNSRFKQIIGYILSHEIAHMWFGNLVTCAWWDVLWLNEGFARYYQYFLTGWVETEMGFETRFITEQIHTSMISDSIDSAHPLTDPRLDSPASVSAHFSTITYNKGASVIRMTEHLLGFDVHRQGLENYLTARSFNTAVPSDLFSALDNVGNSSGALAQYGSGFTIDEYYRSWTEQAGYPLLYVHVNHATGDMTIEQRRFDRDIGYSRLSQSWVIPITFASASNADFNNTKPTHIIRDTLSVINRGSVGDEWVIFNKKQTGFYRVNYDDYTWGLITLALRSNQRTNIHEYNRAQIVDDVLQLARSGLMSYNRAFNILSFLEFETSYAPWAAAIAGFSYLERRFAGTDQNARFQAMFTGWAANVMSQLTYYPIAGESWMQSYLRVQLAPVMCRMNVEACRTAATAQLNALQATPSVEVPVDNRQWVYCNALRQGTAADWTFLWNRFQSHTVYTEKIILLENLGCTSDATSLATMLNAITTENYIIRPQDYGSAMNSAIVGNEVNSLIVLSWIQNNFAQYAATFPNVAGYLNVIAGRLLNEVDIQAYETWVNNNQGLFTAAQLTSLQNGITSTRQLINWTNGITADVVEYLDNGFQAIDLTTVAPPAVTDEPTTILPPEVDPPVVPEDTDGAASLTTSLVTVLLAAAAGMLANRQ